MQRFRSKRPTGAVVGISLAAAGLALSWSVSAMAQPEPPQGIRESQLRRYALTNATVIPRPGERLEAHTVLIRDGVIEHVGPSDTLTVPPGVRVIDATGRTVYAGLIDSAVLVSMSPEPSAHAHWNRHIHPEWRASDQTVPGDAVARELRGLGFASAAVYPDSGILRGSGTVVSLAGNDHRAQVYRERAAMGVGFDRGGGYPNSVMGSIAVLRQTLLDAQWYEQANDIWASNPQGNEPPTRSDSLAALNDMLHGRQQGLFDAGDEHAFLRADRLAREFDLDLVILGSGYEFRRLNEVAATGRAVVVPLNFPERPDVSTLAAAENTTLRDLMTWEQAPTNARRLVEQDVTIALTTHRLRRRADFHPNLRLAIHNGLSKDEALAALTTTPARMLGVEHLVGTVEPGKIANLVVVEGELFDREMKIRDVWVDGRRYIITADDPEHYVGTGTLRIVRGGETMQTPITIDTARNTVQVELPEGERARARSVSFQNDLLSFLIDGRVFDTAGFVQMSGVLRRGEFTGSGALPDRTRFTFTITPAEEGDEVAADPDEDEPAAEDVASEPAPDPADPISGSWAAMLTTDQFGEVPFTMTLTLNDDGTVSGAMDADFFAAELEEGRWDPEAERFTITAVGAGMRSRLSATVSDNQMDGTVTAEAFNATFIASRADITEPRRGAVARRARGELDETDLAPDELNFPLGAYGRAEPPQQENVLITNATIWTCGPEGIIEDGMMLIENGRIKAVGKSIVHAGAGSASFQNDGDRPGSISLNGVTYQVIDATGKHITPGLIDCHSHTGITGGVNEGSWAVTAQVRIADVVDPDDINWYRQLAGGLTAANQLHGSANPIGGQNSVVKLKWGHAADEFIIDDAIAGIKFALGENVKRSQARYPNTRMGVETLIYDSFRAAADYRAEWQRYVNLPADRKSRTIPPKRDLQLEALVEILEGDRLVHCHSYRQDEILMLLRVAEEFGFTVGTLQHILEGYKVADAIASHGAGASSFSDWWAYKMEVMDAIPHNGALMHEVGVNVSFNSDSSELARRMNTEASKAVRYGGVEPHEALKFVALNPAIQLRIDHRTGSLEPDKDADFVIWSGDPLSTYTICEQTWIEGARYFSIDDDREMRRQIAQQRQRLIQKILAKQHGESGSSESEREHPAAGTPGIPGEAATDRPQRGRGRPGAPGTPGTGQQGRPDRPQAIEKIRD